MPELVQSGLTVLRDESVPRERVQQWQATLKGPDKKLATSIATVLAKDAAPPAERIHNRLRLARDITSYDASYDTAAVVSENVVSLTRIASQLGADPLPAAKDAIVRARGLVKAEPDNGRGHAILAVALENAATYGIASDPLEWLGLYRSCATHKGPDYCRPGHARVAQAYAAPRCVRLPAELALDVGDVTELASGADVQSVTLVPGKKGPERIDLILSAKAGEKLRKATGGTATEARIRLGNESLIGTPIRENVSDRISVVTRDMDATFAKLCPTPERRTVPAELALPQP